MAYSAQQANGLSSLRTENNNEDPFRQQSMMASIEKQVNPNLKTRFFFNRNQMKADYDDAFLGADAHNSFETIMNSTGLNAQYILDKGLINSHITWTSYNATDISDYGSELSAESVNAELLYRYFFNDKWNFISGVNFLNDKIKDNVVQGSEASDYVITDSFLSVNYTGNVFDLNFGGRYNHHSVYKGKWVYHVQPTFILTEKTRLHGAFSSAYITPTLGMFFGPYGANAQLQPETNTNSELGVSYELSEDLKLGITFYNRKEKAAIIFNSPDFLYQNNLNETKIKGFEIQGFSSLTSKIDFNMNYSWVGISKEAIRIPSQKANGVLNYKRNAQNQLSLLYAYTGSRTDTDFTTYEAKKLKAFSLFDLHYSFSVGLSDLKTFINVNNLFNSTYTEILGYESLGRNIRFGFEWHIK